jgi:hypothetical protein
MTMHMDVLKHAFIQSLIAIGDADAAKLVRGGLFIKSDFKRENAFKQAIMACGIPNKFKTEMVYKEIFSDKPFAKA